MATEAGEYCSKFSVGNNFDGICTKYSDTNSTAGTPSTGSMGQAQSSDMMKAMQPSDQQMKSMKETGNTDYDFEETGNTDYNFAMMMRAHRQGGMVMSPLELQSGKDRAMRKMAQ